MTKRCSNARFATAPQRHAAQALQPDIAIARGSLRSKSRVSCSQVMQLLALEKQRPPFAVRLAEAAEPYAIGGLSITLRPDRIDELATAASC